MSGLGLEPLLKTMYHSCNDYCTNIIAFVGRGESSDERLCDGYLGAYVSKLFNDYMMSEIGFPGQVYSELLGGYSGY